MRDDKGLTRRSCAWPWAALGTSDQLADVAPQKLREVEQFFATYKLLEDKTVEIEGWADVDRAKALLQEDRERFEAEAERPRGPEPPSGCRRRSGPAGRPCSSRPRCPDAREAVAALVARVQARSPGTRAGARRTSGPSGGCAWMGST